MKFTLTIIILGTLMCVYSSPAKQKAKNCGPDCTYDDEKNVICAKGDGLQFSFINKCVLDRSNCENNRKMVEVSKGKCPGQTGIRLS